MTSLHDFFWPHARTGDVIAALARVVELPLRDARVPRTEDVEHAAAWLGLEAEPVDVAYADLDTLIHKMAPALVRTDAGWLAVASTDARRAHLLDPLGTLRVIDIHVLRNVLVAPIEKDKIASIDQLLDDARVPDGRRDRARRALLRGQLASMRVGGTVLLRLRSSAPLLQQFRAARLPSLALGMLGAHFVRYLLLALGWWLVGRAALEGRIEPGFLSGWALVLVTQLPFAVYASWAQGLISLEAGAILKRRLLAGALALPSDVTRAEGVGHLLGRVLESEAFETLAIGSGFAAMTGAVELVIAVGILALGASGPLMALTLCAWMALTAWAALRYVRARAGWTDARLGMIHDLVERMVGHRTRLAQQEPKRWHEGEDGLLASYTKRSEALDGIAARMWAGLPRGFLLVALALLLPSLVRGQAEGGAIAISLGGSLLAWRALRSLVTGLVGVAGAAVAWEKVRPLFEPAEDDELPKTAEPPPAPKVGSLQIEASGLVYRHQTRDDAVLRGCSLSIGEGDRILLLGASGAGKSTLASILSGQRDPGAGLVLVGGLDKKTIGLAGIRRVVAVAPQFQENFMLSAPLAFNLLMGRRWPPRMADVNDAERVCVDLGLGPLLERMPGGLMQMVGETGWQLSHGERSRVYLARALLQRARVLIFDESFGALDPMTLERVMERVLREEAAIVAIAHP